MAKTEVISLEEITAKLTKMTHDFYVNARNIEELKRELSEMEEVSSQIHNEMSFLEAVLEREESLSQHDN